MSMKYLTAITCDRCKVERHYDTTNRGFCGELDGWAAFWPEAITNVRHGYPRDERPALLVCPDCLTAAEEELLRSFDIRAQMDYEKRVTGLAFEGLEF